MPARSAAYSRIPPNAYAADLAMREHDARPRVQRGRMKIGRNTYLVRLGDYRATRDRRIVLRYLERDLVIYYRDGSISLMSLGMLARRGFERGAINRMRRVLPPEWTLQMRSGRDPYLCYRERWRAALYDKLTLLPDGGITLGDGTYDYISRTELEMAVSVMSSDPIRPPGGPRSPRRSPRAPVMEVEVA